MFSLTTVSKDEALSKWQGAKRALAKTREQGEAMAGRVVAGAEVMAGAFAAGYLDGDKGDVTDDGGLNSVHQIMGYDTSLMGFLVGVGIGMTELLGKHSDHFFHLGLGMGARWAGMEGYNKGQAAKNAPQK